MTRIPTPPTSRFSMNKMNLLLMAGAVVMAALYFSPNAVAEKAVSIPAPSAQALAGVVPSSQASETVVFAGGCFWGIQAVFQHTNGVLEAVSGYAGGKQGDADYQTVSGGGTGHAEAVQVRFDPKLISYAQLLQIYFSVAHDPTQLNRQYPDVGTQYRSAVFTTTPGQKQLTERYIAELNAAKVFPAKIVTQLGALTAFYPAEKYHQNYATLHPDSPYIARFDLPKVANLKAMMPTEYREQPVLVSN
ncbi:MAG: peptide-methionine (S)-S-oxide reductase MsrA [Rhodoferax sp.]|uniref:peptide-methionine (S)-S-oxide reductase MsrA n=1 Tax=Rhodoferax sp. TaxID=50421 RepID=UPI00326482A2